MKETLSLYEGVSIDTNGNVIFNFKKDNNTDIINLDSDVSGQFNEDDIRYIYGYKYNQNASKQQKKIFRDYIKSGKKKQLILKNLLKKL